MDFLNEFELNLVFLEDVENFRQTNAYNNFVGRWSLAVYYQIRFREIALPVELAMETDEFFTLISVEYCTNTNELDGGHMKYSFRLASTSSIISALEKCWNPSIFIPSLLHRFWKLTLQVISRYSTAIATVLTVLDDEHSAESGDRDDKKLGNITSSTLLPIGDDRFLRNITDNTNTTCSVPGKKGHTRSASDQNTTTENLPVISGKADQQKRKEHKDRLILLFLDMGDLCHHLKSVFFKDTVLPTLPDLDDLLKQNLRTSMDEGCDSVIEQGSKITEAIVKNVAIKSIPNLKAVSDIPRLYRRTNRQVPSKPCPYIVSVFLPIQEFYTKSTPICPKDILHAWCIKIISYVADEYLTIVSEVLSAVQKMEESLRRLKKVRDKNAGGTGDKVQGEVAGSTKISDDDKIRLQLYVDVKHFILQMEKGLNVEAKEIKPLIELDNLVIEATKACFDDYITKISTTNS